MLAAIIIFTSLWPFSPVVSLEAVAVDHAIYVSVVEIVDLPLKQKGSLKVKVFTDDLEDAILNKTGEKFKLTKNCERNLDVVAAYITDHLRLTINEHPVKFTPIGCENVDISIWLEYQFAYTGDWSNVDIYCDHLIELFPTQSNVFSVRYNNEKRMFRLTQSKKSTRLSF
jgi:hypothetical protein